VRSMFDTNICNSVARPVPSKGADDVDGRAVRQRSVHLCGDSCRGPATEYWRSPLERSAGSWSVGFPAPRGRRRDSPDACSFDAKAGSVWARLKSDGKGKGRPRSRLGMIVAAVAEASDCVVVTENERDFAGMKAVNPLRGN
jgi:toxin FitB